MHTRTRQLVPTLVALVLLVAPSAASATSSTAAVDELVGQWRLIDKPRAQRKVSHAVESIVDDLNFLVRGVARDKLRAFNAPCAAMTVRTDGAAVSVACDRRPVTTAPLDGTPVRYISAQKDVFRLSHQLDQDRLRQTFAAERGTRTSLYRLSPDGDRLTIATSITSPHFKGAVRYSIVYKRVR